MEKKKVDSKLKINRLMKILIVGVAAALLISMLIILYNPIISPGIDQKPEDTPSYEPLIENIHSETSDFNVLSSQFRVDENNIDDLDILKSGVPVSGVPESDISDSDIPEEDIPEDYTKPDEEVSTTASEEEQTPILIHETNTVEPDGFEKYAVTYHIFTTGVPGPNIAIIGGVHGSERAGFEAAQYLVDNFDFASGNFLIIPKATATAPGGWGPGGRNLNRSFPGDPNGNAAQKVAAVITQLLDDFSPNVIIDFHEAYQDGFSNKILYWPDHEITQEKLEAIRFVSDAINQTDLVGRHLGRYGGRDFGPARSKLVPGTTTREYTLRYNIPVFTTETCMSNKLDVRVDQIVFITNSMFEFFQNKYEMHTIELYAGEWTEE